jgi:hypothetical protein
VNKIEEEWCFFRELGDAVTRWALIEYQLYVLAVVVLAPKDRFVFRAAYTGIENFRSKLAFVDRAIEKGLKDKKLREDWVTLCKRTANKNTQRNHLAHWTCISYPQSTVSGRSIALEPPFRKIEPRRNHAQPPTDAVCVRQIHMLNNEFWSLCCALANFAARVAGKPEDPLLKSLEQPKRPMTIASLRSQMRKALAIQPKPSRRKSTKGRESP